MSHSQVAEAVRGMPTGTHAVLVYDSQKNKRDVLFDHLKLGVKTNGLVYACSEESPGEIRRELADEGVDVGGLEGKGVLSVKNYDDVYIVDGEVNIPQIISGFSSLAWGYQRQGLEGIRASAEMSCFFHERKVGELVEYEKALHREFSFPGRGICAYNLTEMVNSGGLELLWPILRAHKLVIMTGPNGSFAMEPEGVTKGDVEGTMGVTLG
ncbi:MAG TPA: MEDS domain-containing protein [Nitrososphaerales archaeon]|nr:MEDS domain-containing protein [Nitrososphaerales archaeon]